MPNDLCACLSFRNKLVKRFGTELGLVALWQLLGEKKSYHCTAKNYSAKSGRFWLSLPPWPFPGNFLSFWKCPWRLSSAGPFGGMYSFCSIAFWSKWWVTYSFASSHHVFFLKSLNIYWPMCYIVADNGSGRTEMVETTSSSYNYAAWLDFYKQESMSVANHTNTNWKVVSWSNVQLLPFSIHIITERLSLTSQWCHRASVIFFKRFMGSWIHQAFLTATLTTPLSSFLLSAAQRNSTVIFEKFHTMSWIVWVTWFLRRF